MNLRRIHDWLIVGACHADIKGGDDLIAHAILAGYIDTGLKLDMVNGEACYFFHDILHSAQSFRLIIEIFICIVYTNSVEKKIDGGIRV